jgi:hypothetical protein
MDTDGALYMRLVCVVAYIVQCSLVLLLFVVLALVTVVAYQPRLRAYEPQMFGYW